MRDPQCMAEHQRPPLGECTCDAYTRGEEYGRQGGYEVGYKVGLDEGQRDERDKHHTHYCCAVCDYHVMPHRRCILR